MSRAVFSITISKWLVRSSKLENYLPKNVPTLNPFEKLAASCRKNAKN